MKTNYFNAVTYDLITDLDYVPARNAADGFVIYDTYRVFEKADICSFNIVKMFDGDLYPPTGLTNEMLQSEQMLETLRSENTFSDILCLNIFVFSTHPEYEKLDILGKNSAKALKEGKTLTNIIIVLDERNIFIHPGLPFSLDGIDRALSGRLTQDLYQFNTIPDINELVHRQNPAPILEEATEKTPATYIIVGINIAVWLIGKFLELVYGNNYLHTFGIKDSSLIAAGEYWRLLTPMFLHADVFHLGANSLTLLIFGHTVEKIYGTGKFILIYLIGGIAGNIASFAFSYNTSLGASGAVLSVGGALLYVWHKNREAFSSSRRDYLTLVFLVFLNLFYGFIRPGIDNYAHIGGAISGFLTAGILGSKNASEAGSRKTTFIIALIFMFSTGLILGLGG